MKTVFLFFLFYCLSSPAFSQSDTALWGSPATAKQVLQNNIARITLKSTWTTREMCYYGRNASTNNSYEFDKDGYPVRVFRSRADHQTEENYVCENVYKDHFLVRSIFRKKDLAGNKDDVMTQHYNYQNLRDTSNWKMEGLQDCRMVYHFDSLLRNYRTDTYRKIDSAFSLTDRHEAQFDAKNRPVKSINVWFIPRSIDSVVTRYETYYDPSSRSSTTRVFHRGDEQTSIIDTVYRKNKLTKIIYSTFKNKNNSQAYKDILKISRRKGTEYHHAYRLTQGGIIWRRETTYRRYYDAKTRLPIKIVAVAPRWMIYPRGMSREAVTEYTYIRNGEKSLDAKK